MITKLRAAAREESGFTLVELLIVIAILGVLAGVVVFSVAGITDNSNKAACQTEASTVRTAEEAHWVQTKSYASGPTLKSAKLLGSAPTMVTITLTPAAAPFTDYVLAYTGSCVGVTPAP